MHRAQPLDDWIALATEVQFSFKEAYIVHFEWTLATSFVRLWFSIPREQKKIRLINLSLVLFLGKLSISTYYHCDTCCRLLLQLNMSVLSTIYIWTCDFVVLHDAPHLGTWKRHWLTYQPFGPACPTSNTTAVALSYSCPSNRPYSSSLCLQTAQWQQSPEMKASGQTSSILLQTAVPTSCQNPKNRIQSVRAEQLACPPPWSRLA